ALAPQAVQTGKEGGQGLAGAGRGQDERVLAGGDGRPTLALRRRRLAEGQTEPLANGRQERLKWIGGAHADIVRMCACRDESLTLVAPCSQTDPRFQTPVWERASAKLGCAPVAVSVAPERNGVS